MQQLLGGTCVCVGITMCVCVCVCVKIPVLVPVTFARMTSASSCIIRMRTIPRICCACSGRFRVCVHTCVASARDGFCAWVYVNRLNKHIVTSMQSTLAYDDSSQTTCGHKYEHARPLQNTDRQTAR